METTPGHVPVMLEEVVEYLGLRPGQTVLDGTGGGGGHAAALLERIRPGGRLVLLDRDPDAVGRLRARFASDADVTCVHANFRDFDLALADTAVAALDGVLLDLGLSSEQLADCERGFSIDRPGPLDMRFDRTAHRTAADIVNRWEPERLA